MQRLSRRNCIYKTSLCRTIEPGSEISFHFRNKFQNCLYLWWDSREEIFYSSVRVIEAGPQGGLHLAALVPHVLDVLHHPVVLLSHHETTLATCDRRRRSRSSSLHTCLLLRRLCWSSSRCRRSRGCGCWRGLSRGGAGCRCCSFGLRQHHNDELLLVNVVLGQRVIVD